MLVDMVDSLVIEKKDQIIEDVVYACTQITGEYGEADSYVQVKNACANIREIATIIFNQSQNTIVSFDKKNYNHFIKKNPILFNKIKKAVSTHIKTAKRNVMVYAQMEIDIQVIVMLENKKTFKQKQDVSILCEDDVPNSWEDVVPNSWEDVVPNLCEDIVKEFNTHELDITVTHDEVMFYDLDFSTIESVQWDGLMDVQEKITFPHDETEFYDLEFSTVESVQWEGLMDVQEKITFQNNTIEWNSIVDDEMDFNDQPNIFNQYTSLLFDGSNQEISYPTNPNDKWFNIWLDTIEEEIRLYELLYMLYT